MDAPGPEALQEHRHVDALDSCDGLDVVVDQVGEPPQELTSLLDRAAGPTGEGVDRGGHRGVGGEGVPSGEVGQLPIPVEGRADLEGRIRGDPLAAYVVIRGDRKLRDVDARAGQGSGQQGKYRLPALSELMPGPLRDHDPEVVLEAERDIRARLGDRPLDFEAMLAVSNIYRAANAVRNRMEREVLAPESLSWGGFTILFVLWVWGERETAQLADDCGLAKGTLSGMLGTLEKSELVSRERHAEDGRRVLVHLEPEGRDLIERVFPEFNKYEAKFTADLDDEERAELARLLRRVTATADGVPLVADEAPAV